MKTLLAAVLLVTLAPGMIAADAPRELSPEEVELLARTAAEATGVAKLKGFSLARAQMYQFPHFYFFDALVSEPEAQGFSGHYAVNKITAEVWDPYGCSRLSHPSLSELQQKLRTEIGVSAKKYRQFSKEDPCLAGVRH